MSGENQEPFPEDATQVAPVQLYSKREIVLTQLTISFTAKAQDSQWRTLIQALQLKLSRDESNDEVANFTALPTDLRRFSPVVSGALSLSSHEPGTTHWNFVWSRAPDDAPPKDMRASSKSVGGFPGILNKLEALWPTTEPVQAAVEATYILFADDWLFRFPSMRPKRVRPQGQEFRLVPTRWEVEPPSGPVRELVQSSIPQKRAITLTGIGNYTFRWTPRFLNEVDGAVWGGLKNFLKHR